MTLYAEWLSAKQAASEAVLKRREIEDKLIEQMGLKQTDEGIKKLKDSGYVVKATCRMTREIDSDLLQELATAHGLEAHLSTLFRWKPELSMTAWKQASADVTGPLLPAITTTPGRPSFSITVETKE